MGTQKNCLNETVLLGTQNICFKLMGKKILQFYAEHLCLSKPVFFVASSHKMFSNKLITKVLINLPECP